MRNLTLATKPVIAVLLSLLSFEAFAQSKGMTFQAVIRDPASNLVNLSNITVNAKVLAPNGCVLREEKFSSINIANGYLNLAITKGTPVGYDPALAVSKVFDNSSAIASLTCINPDGSVNGGLTTYTPAASDVRKLRISFANGADSIVADFNMRSAPFAVNAENLNGLDDSKFAKLGAFLQSQFTTLMTQFTGGTISANITGNAATATTAGSATTAASATTVTGTVAVANGGTGTTSVAGIRSLLGTGTQDSTTYLRGDGTWATPAGGGAVTSVASRTGAVVITSADLADFSTAADARITTQKGAANGLATLGAGGKVPSSQLALSASDIPSLDYSKITTGKPTSISGYGITDAVQNAGSGAGNLITSMQSGNTAGRPAASVDGKVYFDTQAGVIYRDNGSSWIAVASSGSGGTITAVNPGTGMTGGGSSGSVTLGLNNIAANSILSNMTGASGAPVANTITQILDTVTNTQGSVLYRNGTGWTNLGPGTNGQFLQSLGPAANIQWATPSVTGFTGSLVGDVSGTQGATVVDKIKGQAVSATAATAGQVLRYAGANTWTPAFVAMTDLRSTVTGTNQFVSSCLSNQTLTYNSVGDVMTCSNISLPSGQITGLGSLAALSSVDLSGAQATGIMAAARMPALTGDVTNTAGTLGTTIANNAVTTAKINALAVTDAKINDVAWGKLTGKPTTASGYGITDAVSNAGSAPSVQTGLDASKPSSGWAAGRLYVASDTKKIYYDNGSAWVVVGTTVKADISGVAASGANADITSMTAVTGITSTTALGLNAGGSNQNINLAPTGTGTVDVGSKRITNVATPTATTDAPTKAYVDAAVTGGGSISMISAESASTYTIATGSAYCRSLNAACQYNSDGSGCGATTYTGWKFPTAEDLGIFVGLTASANYIWTRSVYYGSPNYFVSYRLSGGLWSYTNYNATLNYVRCVR